MAEEAKFRKKSSLFCHAILLKKVASATFLTRNRARIRSPYPGAVFHGEGCYCSAVLLAMVADWAWLVSESMQSMASMTPRAGMTFSSSGTSSR